MWAQQSGGNPVNGSTRILYINPHNAAEVLKNLGAFQSSAEANAPN